MRLLSNISHLADAISEYSGRITSWLTSILVLLICYDVAMRYLFDSTSIAIFELEWHIFSCIFLLGAAFAFKHDKHVRVDVFYSKFSQKAQHWINFLGTLLLLIPFCLIVIQTSWRFTLNSLSVFESSPDPGGLPARYIVKGTITLGFLLLLIQAISMLLTSFLGIMGFRHGNQDEALH